MRRRVPLSVFVFFLWIVFEARPAYAYLDPGTGSALVCILVSVVAACGYIAKSIGYAVVGKIRRRPSSVSSRSAASRTSDLVLFSEGRDYWLTFKPIIDELIAREHPFRYLTMDVEDPALLIDHPLMNSRFLGNGTLAYGRVAAARARVMLASTPNIGCPDYPIPKPHNVECLVHVNHGIYDIGTYRRNSLDHYDAVLTMAPFMERSIRRLEALRGSPVKECHPVGTPNMDIIAARAERNRLDNPRPVILIAPTWGEINLLRTHGLDFIRELSATGRYDIVIRPHPQSWRKEANFMQGMVEAVAELPGVSVDRELSPAESMSRADLLITERSGVRFEFAFIYERPVITLAAPRKLTEIYDGVDLDSIWEEDAEKHIGLVLPDASDIVQRVEKALAIQSSQLAGYRDEHVTNFGHAAPAVADWLLKKIAVEA